MEKDEENFEIACENIEKFGLADKIRLIFGEMEHINLSDTDRMLHSSAARAILRN